MAKFLTVSKKVCVNLDQVSHYEIHDAANTNYDSPAESKYLTIYFVRASSGERISLNKEDGENFMAKLKKFNYFVD